MAVDGTVLTSADGESEWAVAGAVEGDVEALDVIPGRWHVATSSGVHESVDEGATWDVVLADEG